MELRLDRIAMETYRIVRHGDHAFAVLISHTNGCVEAYGKFSTEADAQSWINNREATPATDS